MAPSAPTRRNGTTTSTPSRAPNTTQKPSSPAHHTTVRVLQTLLPTPLETLLLLLYPTLLLLGSLFSILDPSARHAPYNPTTQSHPASHAPNYFAKKGNIFNVFFVKIAWFWVSSAYLAFLILSSTTGPPGGLVFTARRLRGLLRWAIVTGWWVLVTQWCFGPGLVDRGFRVSGGACRLADVYEGEGGGKEFWSSQACKAVGGEWRGGHDVSGHVFILVLGSAFLVMEVLPGLVGKRELRDERRVVRGDGIVGSVERGGGEEEAEAEEEGKWGVGAPMVVAGLSWWMLLMTAAYFHTWFEKFTGLLTAFLGIFVVFYLPRAFPAMRNIVGMPGI